MTYRIHVLQHCAWLALLNSTSDETHEHVDDLRTQLGRALSGKEHQNVDAMDRGYGRRVPTQPPGVIAETDG